MDKLNTTENPIKDALSASLALENIAKIAKLPSLQEFQVSQDLL